MSFNKLTSQLQAFDKGLLKKLGRYIQSGYFEVPPAALALFTYMEKLYPYFDEKKLAEKVIARKEPRLASRNSQAKAGTELQKAIDHFLALQQWEQKSGEHPLYLLQAQQQLGLDEFFESTGIKFQKQLQQCPEKDIDYFKNLHLFTEMRFNGFHAKLLRNPGNDLRPVTETLDVFYALKKLRYHCERLSRFQVLGTPYNEENTEELLELLTPFNNKEYPYVYLFVNIYKMMHAPGFEEGAEFYQRIHSFISGGNYSVLPQGVQEGITYLINYCLFWNNHGFEKAGADALDWYEFRLKHNLLLHKGMMQPSEFRNIVSLAINSKKNETWLKQFIETYWCHLPQEYAATNYDFAMGQYHFYRGEYDLAMPLFQRAQAKDEPVFNMIVRHKQFSCMYEQNPDNKEVLMDYLIAWERQLHRQAAQLHQLKQVFGKVINYSKKVLAANEPGLKEEIVRALEQERYFAGKKWLLKQLQDNRQRKTGTRAPASA